MWPLSSLLLISGSSFIQYIFATFRNISWVGPKAVLICSTLVLICARSGAGDDGGLGFLVATAYLRLRLKNWLIGLTVGAGEGAALILGTFVKPYLPVS